MKKSVKFIFEDGSEKTFLLNDPIKGLMDSNNRRPIKAIFNFSKGCVLSKVEEENAYCTAVPSLNPLNWEVIYES